ncbi:unnamed protein product [Ascophyllum nodosum]
MAAGGSSSCAVLVDGFIKCWVMNVRRSYLRIRFNTSWTNHVRACGEV